MKEEEVNIEQLESVAGVALYKCPNFENDKFEACRVCKTKRDVTGTKEDTIRSSKVSTYYCYAFNTYIHFKKKD